MQQISEILFEEMPGVDGSLGLITLNRPQVLNALNLVMFNALDKQLAEWAEAEHIKAVVIRAVEGRAFCAGGDIRAAYERGIQGDPTLPEFFGDEYRMNARIYHFPKPYIAFMDGITMGGGAGISLHGSHRVGTERLLFAMPETGIGFYPDVGATYFLPRLAYKMGYYLGLTGARIAYNDCYALELINHAIASECLPQVLQKLADTSLKQHADAKVSEVLNSFQMDVPHSKLMDHNAEAGLCFSKNTMEEILNTLEHYPSAWCEEVTNLLLVKSPTSLKVTLRQLQMGSRLKFDDCMKLEYQLTSRFLQGKDFFEGIRAVVIDKDQQPKWQPKKLEDVKASDVEAYFK